MTKHKHNKKRNTGFLFESLVTEMTKSIVEGNKNKAEQIKEILSNTFYNHSVLSRELDCYRSLLETKNLDTYTAEKMLFQAKKKHEELPHSEIFAAQTMLIKNINETLSPRVYNNFVPNYRSYATLAQVFNTKTSVKRRVLMEKQILEFLTSSPTQEPAMKSVTSLVVQKYVQLFNTKYSDLLAEQKSLLSKYVVSIGDNYPDFLVYLNEELKRITTAVQDSLNLQEVKEDSEMLSNTHKLIKEIDTINFQNINEKTLLKILKLQALVNEYQADDH